MEVAELFALIESSATKRDLELNWRRVRKEYRWGKLAVSELDLLYRRYLKLKV